VHIPQLVQLPDCIKHLDSEVCNESVIEDIFLLLLLKVLIYGLRNILED
jgi:hypothetical protein